MRSNGISSVVVAVLGAGLLTVSAPVAVADTDPGRPGFAVDDGVRISYVEYGPDADHAPTVVITGGFPVNSNVMEPEAVELARRGLHVVRYDFRGSGESDHPTGVDAYSMPALAGDLGAVIDATAAGHTVNIYGEAWGPYIASEYSHLRPGRISSIISAGVPSWDLGMAALKRQTLRAATDPNLLAPVAAQWAILAYQWGFNVPEIPELILSTGIPNALGNVLGDLVLGQLQKLHDDPASVDRYPTTAADAIAGINKYRWFVTHRMPYPPAYDYLDVPQVRVYQMTEDPYETELLLDGLADRTPDLRLYHLRGDHASFVLDPDIVAILLNGVQETIARTPQR